MQGMDGSKVAEVYLRDNNSKDIEDYCAVDVLITYGVYLAVQKFRGIIDEEVFKEAKQAFYAFLVSSDKPDVYRQLAEMSEQFFDESLSG